MALLQSQINTEDTPKLSMRASSLSKVLEHKAHLSKTTLSHNIKPARLHKASSYISSIEEAKPMCNYIVGVYKKLGSNQQTRLTMQSIFMSLESHAANIVKNLRLVVPKVSGAIWNQHVEL